ncbi:MAG: dTMP kinase [Chloroflexota bacterium]|nr:MAG: dTMP kinase [Chloroflexota bacterium]
MGSLFITFEGTEGSGKSTQVKLLRRKLARRGVAAVLTAEPGGTPLSNRIRSLFKAQHPPPMVPLAELLLFNAARAQLVETVIKPSLAAGKVVICDRYTGSTLAYQGFGRCMDLDLVETANRLATGGLQPDLVFLLDLPPGVGLQRKSDQRLDRFEREALEFHERVREGYLTLSRRDPQRWVILEAEQDPVALSQSIWDRVQEALPVEVGCKGY